MSDIAETPSTPAFNTPLSGIKHAWYSHTQESVLKQSRIRDSRKDKTKAKGIPIYRGVNGEPIRVTMVSDTIEHNTGFKDMKYMGEVSIFIGLGEFSEDIQ